MVVFGTLTVTFKYRRRRMDGWMTQLQLVLNVLHLRNSQTLQSEMSYYPLEAALWLTALASGGVWLVSECRTC